MVLRIGVAWLLVCALSACGGGGGGDAPRPGDPANQADGLGAAGHKPGTVELGSAAFTGGSHAAIPQVAVAISDLGQALAVWQVKAAQVADDSMAWAQTSPGGVWSAAGSLPQASNAQSFYGLVLRMNSVGNAVLGWVSTDLTAPYTDQKFQAVRFIQGTGWEAQVNDVSGGSSAATYHHTSSWDLSILDDDALITSVRLPGTTGYTNAILRVNEQGQKTIGFHGNNQNVLIYSPYAAFSPKLTNGYGLSYRLTDSAASPGQIDITAQLASVYTGGFAPFPVATYRSVCYTEAYDSPLVAAVTQQAEGVLAVVTGEVVGGVSSCSSTHELRVHRVYTQSSIMVTSTRLNGASSFLPVAPVVVVDQAGNALAVWKETTGSQPFGYGADTTRLMWSRSLHGDAWTTPAPLIANLSELGVVPREGHIALAMNPNGEAVLSVKLHGLSGHSLNQSIVVGRFSFGGGWSSWSAVANKAWMSEPQVAINASGKAVLVYTAWALDRIGGRAPTVLYGEPQIKAYALSL